MYLAMLDKLIVYCEAHHKYEAGLACGNRILRYDRARERTHRQPEAFPNCKSTYLYNSRF